MTQGRKANAGPGEFDLIARIRALATAHRQAPLGIGDDCAILRVSPGAEILVTTDMLMEGRHFQWEEAGPEAVGHKALGVNLSDIAAMAGVPIAAFVAVALPKGRAEEVAMGLLDGMRPLAQRYGVALAGGDTNAWDGPLVVSVTLVGEVEAGTAIRRSGAKPGDLIFVTGPLGGSLLGRHLSPNPRIEEARALRRLVDIHAMIDISDGLAADLGHILEESGNLGAVLDADDVPIHTDAMTMSGKDGRTPLDHALGDGEDFELCFTVSPEQAGRLDGFHTPGMSLHRVGIVSDEPGLWLRGRDGSLQRSLVRGFDHLARSAESNDAS